MLILELLCLRSSKFLLDLRSYSHWLECRHTVPDTFFLETIFILLILLVNLTSIRILLIFTSCSFYLTLLFFFLYTKWTSGAPIFSKLCPYLSILPIWHVFHLKEWKKNKRIKGREGKKEKRKREWRTSDGMGGRRYRGVVSGRDNLHFYSLLSPPLADVIVVCYHFHHLHRSLLPIAGLWSKDPCA